ncbi:MAG: hypothetical protein DCF16_19105 [Alphaproteobacteria bacterium]|nr:MAG: hypothetical protein DCF16_19105 [Alphaproteobacteria bacterium]
MFDQTPIHERHVAAGVFAAIGLAGFGAVYLLITGGFAPIAPQTERSTPAPNAAFDQVVDRGWAPVAPTRVTPTSYVPETGSRFVEETDETLAGSSADAPIRDPYTRSYDDIARDIEALYEQATYVEDAEAAAAAAQDAFNDEAASAYENASPW